jgi:hypothetical protein
LRDVVARDLADASLADLSPDRQFATAYNAVLQLSKMAIACAGYRIVGPGHHQTTFVALPLAMGPEVAGLARYFDTCRRKRNIIDYDLASAASETEAEELVEKADEFKDRVERWITTTHPALAL